MLLLFNKISNQKYLFLIEELGHQCFQALIEVNKASILVKLNNINYEYYIFVFTVEGINLS